MFTRRIQWWLYIIFMIVLLTGISSCDDSDNGDSLGYNEYTLSRGGAHFSFEYPEGYEEDHGGTILSRWVLLSFSRSLIDYDYTDSIITVSVYQSGIVNRPDIARTALEEDVSNHSTWYKNFQMLERSEIDIGNLPGQLLVTSYTLPMACGESGWKWSSVLLRRDVFFDYDGFIWTITMFSEEDRIEADETIWEHLLETSRFLD